MLKEDLVNRVKFEKAKHFGSMNWQQTNALKENSTSNKRIILIVIILVLLSFALLKI